MKKWLFKTVLMVALLGSAWQMQAQQVAPILPLPNYGPPRMIWPWLSPFNYYNLHPNNNIDMLAKQNNVLTNFDQWGWVMYRGYSLKQIRTEIWNAQDQKIFYRKQEFIYDPNTGYKTIDVQGIGILTTNIVGPQIGPPLFQPAFWGISLELKSTLNADNTYSKLSVVTTSSWIIKQQPPGIRPREVLIKTKVRNWPYGAWKADVNPNDFVFWEKQEVFLVNPTGSIVVPTAAPLNWDTISVDFTSQGIIYN